MTNKEIRKLNRAELLEILVSQQKEIDRLSEELEAANKALEDRSVRMRTAGSLAEASIAMTHLMEEAQEAADIYLHNVIALGSHYLETVKAQSPGGKEEASDEQEREAQH